MFGRSLEIYPDAEFLPVLEVGQNIVDVSAAIQVFPLLGQKYTK
ncbi:MULTISPECIES: hypothetical protein [Cyanophyceae]|nr:hypothetical protein [Trichocoleus sp. FACHB-832]